MGACSTLVFEDPIRLEEGESVFLTFINDSGGSDLGCTMLCRNETLGSSRHYSTVTLDAPVDWVDLVDSGVDNPLLTAVGGAIVKGG